MSAELDELEELLLAQCTDDKPRRHAQKLLKKLRKSLQRAEFKYDRLLREKAIQSKLLTQTSAELEEAVARAQQATREAEAQRARAEAAAVEIQLERERSERLLYSVLPRPIAERMKAGESTIADSYRGVTVMFADIVRFTHLAARLPATDLVRVLNTLFSTFDNLAQRLGVEKIKTIGDAYMIVAGVPVERPDHANAVAEFALMLQEELQRIELPVDARVVLRIGVHSGQVVAGVIGTDKFTYDLWGDTVNTASRMESHGVPGRIQVSDATYELLKDDYAFEPRGTIRVKGKGTMETYFLLGRRADPTSSPATSDPPS
ncbi:MAG: hypothetical protein H6713_34520 [Myxococcales bacterium]|nr:hypothetical protein [Myxococcales bacterium]